MNEVKGGRPEMRVGINDNLLGQQVIYKASNGKLFFGTVLKQENNFAGRPYLTINTKEGSTIYCYLDEAIENKQIFYNR